MRKSSKIASLTRMCLPNPRTARFQQCLQADAPRPTKTWCNAFVNNRAITTQLIAARQTTLVFSMKAMRLRSQWVKQCRAVRTTFPILQVQVTRGILPRSSAIRLVMWWMTLICGSWGYKNATVGLLKSSLRLWAHRLDSNSECTGLIKRWSRSRAKVPRT